MTQPKPILISTLAASLLVLAGCTTQTATNANTANQNTNTEVVVNTNEAVSNENTNTEQGSEVDLSAEASAEVDTSDWLTYTNEEYGFSFKYPPQWSLEVLSSTEIYLTSTSQDTIKFYIQSYQDAPEKEGEAYALLLTKTELVALKQDIINNADAIVNGIPISVSIGYDVPGADFYKLAEFFINNDNLQLSLPIHAENVEYPEQAYNDEVRVWSEDVINKLNNGELLSGNAKEAIKVFNGVIKSLQLQ